MMPDKPIIKTTSDRRPTWRAYQARLKGDTSARRRPANVLRFILGGAILIAGLFWLCYPIIGNVRKPGFQAPASRDGQSVDTAFAASRIAKKDVRILIDEKNFVNLLDRNFSFEYEGHTYTVETSLEPALQNHLLKAMDRTNSRYIGMVAMDPATGRIVAMVSFDKTGALKNPCTAGQFPAASIFKIVTAAAAVEQCGYTSQSRLKFNGYKHTLYKSQLRENANRYTNTISFKDSFAQSVNPIFGKIGALYLGKPQLEAYAQAFGFNRRLSFEIPCATSRLTVDDEPYHWAEIASGFNNQTTLSPLHGALLAAVPVTQGQLVEPTIVDRIVDESGDVLYHNNPIFLGRATTAETSRILTALMEATVKSGTCRKAFRGYKRDKILSRLEIGGKTGSIYNKEHTTRFDWFVGFAHEKMGSGRLVVSVLVAHEDYIGIRASEYARMAFKLFFEKYMARNRQPEEKITVEAAKGRTS
jgi:cell division protein FtsI/penicillin-binding protein 2